MSQLNTHYLSSVFRLTILHIVTFIIKFSMEILYSGMYGVIVQYVLYGSSTILKLITSVYTKLSMELVCSSKVGSGDGLPC